MGPVGDQLGVRCAALWLCGRSFLPAAAEAVLAANHIVASGSDDAGRFARTGTVAGTPHSGTVYGRVYPSWDRLRDELQSILALSADRLYATGDALVTIANAYADADDASRAGFQRDVSDYSSDPDYRIYDPSGRKSAILP